MLGLSAWDIEQLHYSATKENTDWLAAFQAMLGMDGLMLYITARR